MLADRMRMSIWDSYIYKLGYEYLPWSGGWIVARIRYDATATKESDHLWMRAQNTHDSQAQYANDLLIDLTPYSSIKYDCENVGVGNSTQTRSDFGVHDDNVTGGSIYNFTTKTAVNGPFSRQIVSLNISAVTDSMYIFCGARCRDSSIPANASILRVYNIWLE